MVKEEKSNLFLLAIVGIVAVVGIVVLVLNVVGTTGSWNSSDLSGEAIKMKADSSFSVGDVKIMKTSSGGHIILGSTPCCTGCDVEGGSCDECDEYCK